MLYRLRPVLRSTALLLTLMLPAACGEELLAPPDGAACTKGSIAPGDSVRGRIAGTSCVLFDNLYNSEHFVWGESWTLHAPKNSAYVVRLRHVENDAGADNLDAYLVAYTRGPTGDLEWATGWYGTFGATNANGGRNEEMYLVTTTDQTFSLRVQVGTLADTGSYTLSVERCPMTTMVSGTEVPDLDLAKGCVGLSYDITPRRLTFITFPIEGEGIATVSGIRTAGNGALRARITGPDLDVGCYTYDCSMSPYTAGTSFFEVSTYAYFPGIYSLFVGIPVGSEATLTARVGPIPALTSSPSTVPSRQTRPRSR